MTSCSIENQLSASGAIQLPNKSIRIFTLRDFLDEQHCAELIRLIDSGCRPSTVADGNDDATFRTSDTTDLDQHHPSIVRLEHEIIALTGLNPRHGEPAQGQRYEVGQEFKEHTDYFEPNGRDYVKYCTGCGQRTWTVMVYLNKPELGGATRFKKIKKTFKPEVGRLLAWNNLTSAGQPNPDTLHHGMKVKAGRKYIITKWFRQHPWPHGT